MVINGGTRPTDVTGGTSNTVFVSEARVGLNDKDRREVWAMRPGGSSLTGAQGYGDCGTPNDRNEYSNNVENSSDVRRAMGVGSGGLTNLAMGCSNDTLPNNWPNWQAGARSRHTGGVNAAVGDGCVRFVRDSVTVLAGHWANVRSDGEIVTPGGPTPTGGRTLSSEGGAEAHPG